jgi:hypothetical protein
VIEPFLIRAGLLTRDDRRQLTAAGHEHVSNLCPKGVEGVSNV